MKNIEALKATCNALANTFYPDEATLQLALLNGSIDPQGAAVAKDKNILTIAIRLVLGYVEGSRNENGISTSVRVDAMKSIRAWCADYGLDADEVLAGCVSTIEDISYIW